jgi:hypothetical protein
MNCTLSVDKKTLLPDEAEIKAVKEKQKKEIEERQKREIKKKTNLVQTKDEKKELEKERESVP